jgi:predicted amidophosphoribosyltransferase
MNLNNLRIAVADLFLGRTCSGCTATGSLLCSACETALTPAPEVHEYLIHSGLHWLPAAYSGTYRGVLRRVLYTYKDHHIPELATQLSPLLSAAISAVREHASTGAPIRVVPVPSRTAAIRRRGFDPVGHLLRTMEKQEPGSCGVIAPWLRDLRGRGASKRLDRSSRLDSAIAAFGVHRDLIPGTEVIVVDDIITTGSTISEAARTLEKAGCQVRGVAAIAHTR